ncbi:hypothetical protein CPB84DRAFT_1784405 [Gymnopilus junonius]|uniref:F-box domain-containing protein n=1 Tax=Gymnopilus junonius TaxID=109634 RepID=A0A9P5NLK1_GYMJU|nr:hypothetical protein CPB84DRAFT_1784405 [Gymnopilus junonius]
MANSLLFCKPCGVSYIPAPISCLDHVPLEIWQQIFLILLSSETVSALDEIYGSIWGRATPPIPSQGKLILPQTPSTISQVCSHWKEYAFGMPDFWNVFFVKAPRSKSPASTINLTRLINSRLSLSRSMPLKICINSKEDEEGARTFIRSIIPSSSRWETVHFHIPPNVLGELSSLRPTDLPLLTSLKTHIQIYALGTVSVAQQLKLFEKIPPIRRFCTSYLPPQICHIYAGLEELHIQENRSETWSTLSVLAACPKLRVLTLSGVGITLNNASTADLVLPELHTLNLEHPTGRERLLEMMQLPKLQALTIGGSCSGESTRSVFSAIITLMDRSKISSLESLSIYFERHFTDPTLLVSFLSRNPLLKKLRIDDTWKFLNHRPLVTDCLLRALTLTSIDNDGLPSVPYLCSQLQSISLMGCSDFEDGILLALLNSRCRPTQFSVHKNDSLAQSFPVSVNGCRSPATLKEVNISIKRNFGGQLLEMAESLRLIGLSIDLRRV